MKTITPNRRLASISALALLGSAVVAWSPPANEDIIVSSGTPAVVLGPLDSNTHTTGTAFRGLIAGASNTAQTYGGYGAIIGSNNNVKTASSLVVGSSNDVTLNATTINQSLLNSGVFGEGNLALDGSNSCLISGKMNNVKAVSTLVSGHDNDVRGAQETDSAYYSAAIGQMNEVYEVSGWTMGYGNAVTAGRGVAIGTGTLANGVSATALGKYNSAMVAGDVLVVGTGANAANRTTSLSVRSDGSVVLGNVTSGNVVLTKAQGDISMGVYQ